MQASFQVWACTGNVILVRVSYRAQWGYMPIYVFRQDGIDRVGETTFSQVGLHERRDLQWLMDHNIDIRCVRLKPYSLEGRLLVDVQQIIPLPDVEEYQVQVREKAQKERQARTSGADFTRFDVQFDGEAHASMWKRNAIFL